MCANVCNLVRYFLLIAHSSYNKTWMRFHVEHRFMMVMRSIYCEIQMHEICIKYKLKSLWFGMYNERFENCIACKSYNENLRTKHVLWFRQSMTYKYDGTSNSKQHCTLYLCNLIRITSWRFSYELNRLEWIHFSLTKFIISIFWFLCLRIKIAKN